MTLSAQRGPTLPQASSSGVRRRCGRLGRAGVPSTALPRTISPAPQRDPDGGFDLNATTPRWPAFYCSSHGAVHQQPLRSGDWQAHVRLAPPSSPSSKLTPCASLAAPLSTPPSALPSFPWAPPSREPRRPMSTPRSRRRERRSGLRGGLTRQDRRGVG